MGSSSRFVPGVVVGYLEVLEPAYKANPDNPRDKNYKIKCLCHLCGREVDIFLPNLYEKRHNTVSCGCFKKALYANPEVRPHEANGQWKKLKKARK